MIDVHLFVATLSLVLCFCVCVLQIGELYLFCKGADSSIFPRVISGKVDQVRARVEHNAVVSARANKPTDGPRLRQTCSRSPAGVVESQSSLPLPVLGLGGFLWLPGCRSVEHGPLPFSICSVFFNRGKNTNKKCCGTVSHQFLFISTLLQTVRGAL